MTVTMPLWLFWLYGPLIAAVAVCSARAAELAWQRAHKTRPRDTRSAPPLRVPGPPPP